MGSSFRDLGLGLEADPRLDVAALRVVGVELERDGAGALLVLGQQQLQAGVGPVQAPRGVQSRAQPEADRAGVDRARVDLRDVHQRAQAGLARRGEPAQALAHQPPVLPDERHDVGDGGERDEVEVLLGQPRVLAGRLQQRPGELVRDRRGTQVRAWVVADPRVHDRRVGQVAVGPRAVVVGDDHVHPGRPGARDLLDGRDRAVDGHEQSGAALRQPVDGRGGEPVAVAGAVGQVPVDVGADRAQRPDQDRGRAHAVDVVVAVDRDPAAAAHVGEDLLGGVAQAAEGVQRVLVGARQERARGGRLAHPAAHEDLREHVRHAQLGGQAVRGGVLVGPQGQVGVLMDHARERMHRTGRNGAGARPGALLSSSQESGMSVLRVSGGRRRRRKRGGG